MDHESDVPQDGPSRDLHASVIDAAAPASGTERGSAVASARPDPRATIFSEGLGRHVMWVGALIGAVAFLGG
jgi:hypothetical protein